MIRSMRFVLLTCTVLLAIFCLQEGVAAACTQRCTEVPGPQQYCYRCLEMGYFTNESCADSGDCGCYDVPNSCWGVAAAASTQSSLQSAIFGAPATEPARSSQAVHAPDPAATRFTD